MTATASIAIDFGAESGRVAVGLLDGDGDDARLSLHEVHRFLHTPVPMPDGLAWDFTHLWQQVLEGLRAAQRFCDDRGAEAVSIGVDTWGVDWSLVGPGGELLGLPRCYREPAFAAARDGVLQQAGAGAVYDATGIAILPFNTLYQVAERHGRSPGLFAEGATLLFMPDLFNWMLTGRAVVERTIASTSQMVDARTGTWNTDLLERLDLPTHTLGEIVDPGDTVGELRDGVREATGLPGSLRVIAVPSHDTASAVAAVPADGGGSWCYLSSGTWSLLGAELDEPCINPDSAAANFTNELGLNGTVRFLRNIAGLWPVQEVRRQLEGEGKRYDYAALTEAAAGASPLRTLIPVNDPVFAEPGRMIDKVKAYARQTDQAEPGDVGAVVRCCLESLAMAYRATVEDLEGLLGRRFEVLHIVGGGGKNGLLNRMAAHATGLRVVVGPEEATVVGNLLTQAMGLGRLRDVAALRGVVRRSFDLQTIEAERNAAWDGPYERYRGLPPAEA